MKKKAIFIVLLVFLVLAMAGAQEDTRKTVTILDFKTSNIKEDEMRVFVDYVTSHIVSTGLFRVIDREQREVMLDEINFSYSGAADEKAQLEIGKVLSADMIILGSLGRVGDRYLLNIKLVAVQTGETLNSSSMAYNSLNDLIDNSAVVAYTLLGLSETGEKIPTDEEIAAMEKEEAEQEASREQKAEPVPPGEFKKSALEVAVGTVLGSPSLTVSGSYVFSFSQKFHLGAWLGGRLGGGNFTPLFGAKAIFGNKQDGFAFALNLGLYPGLGVYYKNIFLNVSPTIIFNYDTVLQIEAGYSLSL